MAIVDGEGYWIDPRGRKWPKKAVQKLDQRRDKLVEDAHKSARKLQAALAAFNRDTRKAIQDFLEWSAAEAGVPGNAGGNYTFSSFSGHLRLIIKVSEFLVFDERLQQAKGLIDHFLVDEVRGSNPAICVLIQDVFQVDKQGRINARRVLALRKHQFKDTRWKRAMDLISDSVSTQNAKAYLMLQERLSSDAEWKTLRLDLSALAPEVTK
jgi:hypothetical protein